MDKIIDTIQHNDLIHAIAIILLMADIWRRIVVIKIKNKVIDNLCKNNYDLLNGRSDLAWKRMKDDLLDEFKPTRWISFDEKKPKTKKPIIVCDEDFKNPDLAKFEKGLWSYPSSMIMAYWAPLPKERLK